MDCKQCGNALVPVVYGFPFGDTIAAAEGGDIVLGGCTVEDDSPHWACAQCPPPLW